MTIPSLSNPPSRSALCVKSSVNLSPSLDCANPALKRWKIITEYKVIKELETSSILSVNLVTGKTHQIRAHLAYVGNQIIGDGKYGVNSVNNLFNAKTQRLTAYKLTFSFDKNSPIYSLDGKVVEINKEFWK